MGQRLGSRRVELGVIGYGGLGREDEVSSMAGGVGWRAGSTCVFIGDGALARHVASSVKVWRARLKVP